MNELKKSLLENVYFNSKVFEKCSKDCRYLEEPTLYIKICGLFHEDIGSHYERCTSCINHFSDIHDL